MGHYLGSESKHSKMLNPYHYFNDSVFFYVWHHFQYFPAISDFKISISVIQFTFDNEKFWKAASNDSSNRH